MCVRVRLVILLGLVVTAAHAQPAGAAPVRGVTLHSNWYAEWGYGATDAELEDELEAARSMHADVVRLVVPWNVLEPTKGTWDPALRARIDAVMNDIAAAEMKAVMTVFGTPCWAAPVPALCNPTSPEHALAPAARPADFGSAVGRMVGRWGANTAAVEIWNEPFYPPAFHGSPAEYAELVNAAGAAADARVWPGEILAAAHPEGQWPYGSDWLAELYDAGMTGHDSLSAHPYDYDWDGEVAQFNNPLLPGSRFNDTIDLIRGEMRVRGDASSGIWLTEFGATACPMEHACVSEQKQAEWLVGMVASAERRPYVRGSLAYALRDQEDPVTDWGRGFGVLRNDFSERPAAGALRAAFAVPPVVTSSAERTLTVQRSGSGTVGSYPQGIDCGSRCSAVLDDGAALKLTAAPATGWVFSGWTGCPSASGPTCEVAMTANRSVTARFVRRKLMVEATGDGRVQSSPAGIDCGASCSLETDDGAVVILSAAPSPGSSFRGWTNCPASLGSQCYVSMGADHSVGARFTPLRTLGVETTGWGAVTSSPEGLNCGLDCSITVEDGTNVTLTAHPTAGWAVAWEGCDAVNGLTCTVAMNGERSVKATFARRTLTVKRSGSGTFTSTPGGLVCAVVCSLAVDDGAQVTLRAIASPGWVFRGWSNCPVASGSQCAMTMSSDRSVEAEFVALRKLTVTRDGSGGVTSDPAGIDCGAACALVADEGSTVTLRAEAAPGWAFRGWTDCPTATGAVCTVRMSRDYAVAARFAPQRRVGVRVSGPGRVTSAPAGIDCRGQCELKVDVGSDVVLTATPDRGYAIAGWWGCRAAAGSRCVAETNTDTEVAVAFAPLAGPQTALGSPTARKGGRAFRFRISGAGGTGTLAFRCALDGGPAAPCSSGTTFAPRPGRHVLSVAAVDELGRADPTPAIRRFRVARRHAP
jgi:uncharacterized repeat protein (TIGR02543 family)